MKVSIVTVTFNSESMLPRCLESIKAQTYSNLEHIIIDGGSSDMTIKMLEMYKNTTAYHVEYITEPDNGIYDALNKGILRSTGDVIGLLHSDDVYHSDDVIQSVVNYFNEKKCDVLYGDLIYVKNNGRVFRWWRATNFSLNKLRNGWMPPHPTLFIRKAVFNIVGLYSTRYRISSDYDFIVRLFQQKLTYGYLENILVDMQVGGVSNNSIKNILQKMYEDYRIISTNSIGGFGTLLKKNLGKLTQFFLRSRLMAKKC